MTGRGQPLGVLVTRARQPQRPGLLVHQLHEALGPCPPTPSAQRHGRVVAGLHDHALEQVLYRDLLIGLDEHARAGHAPRALTDSKFLVQRELARLERIEHHIGGHQLGQRGRFDRLIWVLGGQHLPAGGIQQQPGARRDLGRLRRLGMRHRYPRQHQRDEPRGRAHSAPGAAGTGLYQDSDSLQYRHVHRSSQATRVGGGRQSSARKWRRVRDFSSGRRP
jgi:hypothetical protein